MLIEVQLQNSIEEQVSLIHIVTKTTWIQACKNVKNSKYISLNANF